MELTLQPDGSWTGVLWRGVEGQERVVRREAILPDTGRCKDLEGRREPRPWRERVTHEPASTDRNTR